MKMPEFGTKTNAIFGYFFVWNFKKLFFIFEISTRDSVCMQNFAKKTKMSKIEGKNALLGYFWARIPK